MNMTTTNGSPIFHFRVHPAHSFPALKGHFMFDFLTIKKSAESLKQSVDSLQSRVNELRAELQSTNAQINQTRNARINRAEMADVVGRWVEKSAAGFTAAVAAQMERDPKNGLSGNVGLFSLVRNSSGKLDADDMDGVMCALFGAQIKQAIVDTIHAVEWPNEGLPKAERAKEIERLDKICTKLGDEITEIVQGATQSGITIK